MEIWKNPTSLMNALPSTKNYFHLEALLNLHGTYHLNLLNMALRFSRLAMHQCIPTARSDLRGKTNRWSSTSKLWRANSTEPDQFV